MVSSKGFIAGGWGDSGSCMKFRDRRLLFLSFESATERTSIAELLSLGTIPAIAPHLFKKSYRQAGFW